MRNWNLQDRHNSKGYCGVLSLPMRNWNTVISLNNSSSSCQFWVYLWGIETRLPAKKIRRWCTFWVYLWGIETFWIHIRQNVLITFWVYLWGIETVETWGTENIPRKFWVYLWGIETWPSSPQGLPAWNCFESTYEELKLIGEEGRGRKLGSFESTYEELKPENFFRIQ